MSPNLRLAINAAVLAIAMVGLAYASVPLYRIFCQVTGFGGTTQVGKHAPGAKGDRIVTVRFNADIDPALNWDFHPGEHEMKVRVGEQSLTHFVAENHENIPVTGHAAYNVVPHEVGSYFVKIACFCFTNQTLQAHQKVDMPVSFYIDPEFLTDPEMRDIDTITLSYIFYPKK